MKNNKITISILITSFVLFAWDTSFSHHYLAPPSVPLKNLYDFRGIKRINEWLDEEFEKGMAVPYDNQSDVRETEVFKYLADIFQTYPDLIGDLMPVLEQKKYDISGKLKIDVNKMNNFIFILKMVAVVSKIIRRYENGERVLENECVGKSKSSEEIFRFMLTDKAFWDTHWLGDSDKKRAVGEMTAILNTLDKIMKEISWDSEYMDTRDKLQLILQLITCDDWDILKENFSNLREDVDEFLKLYFNYVDTLPDAEKPTPEDLKSKDFWESKVSEKYEKEGSYSYPINPLALTDRVVTIIKEIENVLPPNLQDIQLCRALYLKLCRREWRRAIPRMNIDYYYYLGRIQKEDLKAILTALLYDDIKDIPLSQWVRDWREAIDWEYLAAHKLIDSDLLINDDRLAKLIDWFNKEFNDIYSRIFGISSQDKQKKQRVLIALAEKLDILIVTNSNRFNTNGESRDDHAYLKKEITTLAYLKYNIEAMINGVKLDISTVNESYLRVDIQTIHTAIKRVGGQLHTAGTLYKEGVLDIQRLFKKIVMTINEKMFIRSMLTLPPLIELSIIPDYEDIQKFNKEDWKNVIVDYCAYKSYQSRSPSFVSVEREEIPLAGAVETILQSQ